MVFLYDNRRVRCQGAAGETSLPDSFGLRFPGSFEIEMPEVEELSPPKEIPSWKRIDSTFDISPAALVALPGGTKVRLPEGTQLAFKGAPDEIAFGAASPAGRLI